MSKPELFAKLISACQAVADSDMNVIARRKKVIPEPRFSAVSGIHSGRREKIEMSCSFFSSRKLFIEMTAHTPENSAIGSQI